MSQYQLVVQKGPAPGKTFSLSKAELFLGRDVNNEIVINDAEISRRHCRFIFGEDGYTIEDLGSTNGTFINEKRVAGQKALRYGQVIRVGDNVTLVYEMVGGADQDATIASRQGFQPVPPPPVQTPKPAAPQPVAPPPQQAAPPRKQQAPPAFAGQVPPGPDMEDSPKSRNRVLMIGCGILLVIACCGLIGGWYYIDTYRPDLYCSIIPSLPGCP